MLKIERIEDQGHCTLNIVGYVQLASARELFERVLQEDCSQVVLDFSGCEVEDRALDQLAEMLNQAHLNLAVQGLSRRQVRLLEYLGVSHPAHQ
jgi:anti-anti-sigma regulatory factor